MCWHSATSALLVTVALACADPTAIDVTVYSEVPCSAGAEVALSVAGDPHALQGAAPASVATQCEEVGGGTVRRGNVVIVPQGDKEKPIAFELTTRSDGQPLDPCALDPKGCIVARRQLRFQSRKTIEVRIDLRLSCLGVACPEDQTCVTGACVPAQLLPCNPCGEPDAGPPPDPPTAVTALPVSVGVVTTVAGSGVPAFADGTGSVASFKYPIGLAVDGAGNVWVADVLNNRIRKVTSGGVVTTLAGSIAGFADGTGAAASFNEPYGVAVDGAGTVYVADSLNQRIRKVTSGGVVTTLAGSSTNGFADGTGAMASFSFPVGMAVDGAGVVYVGQTGVSRIRKVTSGGVVTTLAGSGIGYADGIGSSAMFFHPSGVAVNGAGDVYVADFDNNRIRKVTSGGVVTTLAGSGASGFADGAAAVASFSLPYGVALDGAGNVYVADSGNNRIRRVTSGGFVTTVAGSGAAGNLDGTGVSASFNSPGGVAIDGAGDLYVADSNNNLIRKVTATGFGELTVSWTAPAASGGLPITSYTASAAATAQTSRTCSTAGATTCTITALTSGVVYSVAVTATDAVGTSALSAAVLATPN